MIIQRHEKLIDYIREKGSASLDELCEVFDVSKNTIRRDINELELKGLIDKVYGGVVALDSENVVPISFRKNEASTEKEKIGKAAAKLVNDGDVIIIDSGSTTVHMVKYLKNKKNVTIITNGIDVVNEAHTYGNLNMILTGGNLLRETNSLVGIDSIKIIKSLNAKTVFMAATGISIIKGLTNSSMIEAEIKRAMKKSAESMVVLADITKFGVVSLVTFAELYDADYIITDNNIDDEFVNYFIKNNIKLIIAE